MVFGAYPCSARSTNHITESKAEKGTRETSNPIVTSNEL